MIVHLGLKYGLVTALPPEVKCKPDQNNQKQHTKSINFAMAKRGIFLYVDQWIYIKNKLCMIYFMYKLTNRQRTGFWRGKPLLSTAREV